MKETGTAHWESPNTGGTNESGFTALPSGYRDDNNGNFNNLGLSCDFWSATEDNTESAWDRALSRTNSLVYRNQPKKSFGLLVRCLRD